MYLPTLPEHATVSRNALYGEIMKKTTLGMVAVATLACAAAVVSYGRRSNAADHLDSPAPKADPAADVNDVYSWMDGNNAVFAMTVFPAATTAAKFSDKIQYVLHTTSAAKFGDPAMNTDIICTFAADQTAKCWAGTSNYVTGNAGSATGITSADGKFKVFAGLRADPFFFNLSGFRKAVATVKGAAAGLTFNDAKCPQLDAATSQLLRDQLQRDTDDSEGKDFFQMLNGLAIVVSIDKALVTKGGPIVSVWGSTNKSN
jgi:hypothetical protein